VFIRSQRQLKCLDIDSWKEVIILEELISEDENHLFGNGREGKRDFDKVLKLGCFSKHFHSCFLYRGYQDLQCH